MALADATRQPATRMLHTSVSVTMASAAARDTTNTGIAAGWLCRSTNGRRAMIFGAAANSSAAHHGPEPATAKAGTRPRSPFNSVTASTTLAAPICGTNGTVKPKWKSCGIAHRGVTRGEVGVDGKRRLHVSESGDNDAPDALGGVERQVAVMACHQAAHHVGLAGGTEGRAGFAGFLHRDQTFDDFAALDQQRVHRGVDTIDVGPQICEGNVLGGRLFDHRCIACSPHRMPWRRREFCATLIGGD